MKDLIGPIELNQICFSARAATRGIAGSKMLWPDGRLVGNEKYEQLS